MEINNNTDSQFPQANVRKSRRHRSPSRKVREATENNNLENPRVFRETPQVSKRVLDQIVLEVNSGWKVVECQGGGSCLKNEEEFVGGTRGVIDFWCSVRGLAIIVAFLGSVSTNYVMNNYETLENYYHNYTQI